MFAPVPSRKGRPSELLHGGQSQTQHVKESQIQLTSVSYKTIFLGHLPEEGL